MTNPTNSSLDNVAAPQDRGGANILTASGELDLRLPVTELRLPDGRQIRIPTSLLADPSGASLASGTPAAPDVIGPGQTVTVPVLEERLQIDKRTVVTGKVRLDKHVLLYDEQLDEPLAVRTFDVERVVLNQPVEAPPPVRHEGETTIYSLVEEQLVLTRQLIVREELRITRRDTERRDTRTVTLQRETIEVTRTS